jgi:hypothetical protein
MRSSGRHTSRPNTDVRNRALKRTRSVMNLFLRVFSTSPHLLSPKFSVNDAGLQLINRELRMPVSNVCRVLANTCGVLPVSARLHPVVLSRKVRHYFAKSFGMQYLMDGCWTRGDEQAGTNQQFGRCPLQPAEAYSLLAGAIRLFQSRFRAYCRLPDKGPNPCTPE